jgi:hypothetical protein
VPLVLIEAASLIGKPFSKCRAFHIGSILAHPSMIVGNGLDARPLPGWDTIPSLSLRRGFLRSSAEVSAGGSPPTVRTETDSSPSCSPPGSTIKAPIACFPGILSVSSPFLD